MSGPNTISYRYRELQKNGPLIFGRFVRPDDRSQMAAGMLLVDTGSDHSLILTGVAKRLGLATAGSGLAWSATGLGEAWFYPARLEIAIADGSGTTILGFEQEFPEDSGFTVAPPGHGPDGPIEGIGLIGRDILRYAKLTYDGRAGAVELEFDLAACPEARYVPHTAASRGSYYDAWERSKQASAAIGREA